MILTYSKTRRVPVSKKYNHLLKLNMIYYYFPFLGYLIKNTGIYLGTWNWNHHNISLFAIVYSFLTNMAGKAIPD